MHDETGVFWWNWNTGLTWFRKWVFRGGFTVFGGNNCLLTKLERRIFRETTVRSSSPLDHWFLTPVRKINFSLIKAEIRQKEPRLCKWRSRSTPARGVNRVEVIVDCYVSFPWPLRSFADFELFFSSFRLGQTKLICCCSDFIFKKVDQPTEIK